MFQAEVEKPRPATSCGKLIVVLLSAEKTVVYIILSDSICLVTDELEVLCPFSWPFSMWTCVSRYQNVSILDFIGAKGDGNIRRAKLR